jgi:hypothetical protein
MVHAAQSDAIMRARRPFGASYVNELPGVGFVQGDMVGYTSPDIVALRHTLSCGEPTCLDNWKGKCGRVPKSSRVRLEPRHEIVAAILLSNGWIYIKTNFFVYGPLFCLMSRDD